MKFELFLMLNIIIINITMGNTASYGIGDGVSFNDWNKSESERLEEMKCDAEGLKSAFNCVVQAAEIKATIDNVANLIK